MRKVASLAFAVPTLRTSRTVDRSGHQFGDHRDGAPAIDAELLEPSLDLRRLVASNRNYR
jgi:hypothetical protein